MALASIVVKNIQKSFGKVKAVRGVDLVVEKGTIFGLLGPNGAGKTTLIRILTTLMPPDGGSASIEGFDVVKDADAVRQIIGLAGQYAAVDENLTGRENLVMVGRLYHMSIAEARVRAVELLQRFDLIDAADRTLKTYSGGMRRRLDLAASLVNRPPVLFLDEPTTGLDPQSRLALWEIIRELVSGGTTVLLTTQYLEEADYLADSIVVIDHGRIIASGSPKELKSKVGIDVLEVHLTNVSDINRASAALRTISGDVKVDLSTAQIAMPLHEGVGMLPKAVRALDLAHIEIADLTVRHPTLDEVFLKLTGQPTEEIAHV
jgi:ABC-2 type transport system ATP-binding protein